MRPYSQRPSALLTAIIASLGLIGCASTGPNFSQAEQDCRTWMGDSALGSGFGALVCPIYSYFSQQTSPSKVVDKEYLKNNGQLPEQARLMSYKVRIGPKGEVVAGNEVKVTSDIKVVSGRQDASLLIEEETTLFAPGGGKRPLKTARKIANERREAGAYRTIFSVKLPADAPLGVYPVRSVVYLNGKAISRRESQFKVVAAG